MLHLLCVCIEAVEIPFGLFLCIPASAATAIDNYPQIMERLSPQSRCVWVRAHHNRGDNRLCRPGGDDASHERPYRTPHAICHRDGDDFGFRSCLIPFSFPKGYIPKEELGFALTEIEDQHESMVLEFLCDILFAQNSQVDVANPRSIQEDRQHVRQSPIWQDQIQLLDLGSLRNRNV